MSFRIDRTASNGCLEVDIYRCSKYCRPSSKIRSLRVAFRVRNLKMEHQMWTILSITLCTSMILVGNLAQSLNKSTKLERKKMFNLSWRRGNSDWWSQLWFRSSFIALKKIYSTDIIRREKKSRIGLGSGWDLYKVAKAIRALRGH